MHFHYCIKLCLSYDCWVLGGVQRFLECTGALFAYEGRAPNRQLLMNFEPNKQLEREGRGLCAYSSLSFLY